MEREILTMEDVAEYLQVSERTVYDWVLKGNIPAGKIGGTWRFRRTEIEKWLERQFRGDRKRRSRSVMLADILTPERILRQETSTKNEMLELLADSLGQTPEVHKPAELKREIFRREELMSTGIGLGIGIPHVRLDSIDNHIMAMGICPAGIDDYSSIDNQPVQVVCMVAARSDQHEEYIQILAEISSRLKDRDFRNRILSCAGQADAFTILTA
mgnify:CR=1 FL=1